METALAFPEPLPEDPEVVATALETAGIFGVQGDVREAVRWVRRAAELAGDAGIDDRAFALARAAADLTTNYSARAESAAPPPAPAPAASSAPPAHPVSAAQSMPSDGANRVASAPPPPPPPPPVAAQPRPSNRPQESRPPQQAVSVSPIVSLGSRAPQVAQSEEEGEITSQHPPHRARSAESAPPAQPIQSAAATPPSNDTLAALFEEPLTSAQPSTAQSNAAQPSAPQLPTQPRPELMQTLAYRTPEPEPVVEVKQEESPTPVPVAAPEPTVRYPTSESEPGQRYAQHLMTTQVYEPVQPEAAFVDEPVPVLEAAVAPPEASSPNAAPQASARAAVRASIEQSQEEGVYILRLLKNSEAAPFGTSEALVVLVHPADELFAG